MCETIRSIKLYFLFLRIFLINCMLKPKDFNYIDVNISDAPGSFWIQTKLIKNGHIYQD